MCAVWELIYFLARLSLDRTISLRWESAAQSFSARRHSPSTSASCRAGWKIFRQTAAIAVRSRAKTTTYASWKSQSGSTWDRCCGSNRRGCRRQSRHQVGKTLQKAWAPDPSSHHSVVPSERMICWRGRSLHSLCYLHRYRNVICSVKKRLAASQPLLLRLVDSTKNMRQIRSEQT